jgi:hypothetical protein
VSHRYYYLYAFVLDRTQSSSSSSHVILSGFLDGSHSVLTSFKVPDTPSIDLKSIDMPAMDISMPSMDGIMGDLPLPVIGAGLAVLAVLALAAGGGDGKSDNSSPKKTKRGRASSLEIPYDASSRLAYDTWCQEHEKAKFNPDAYDLFREMFEKKAIADATSKKLARDLAAFDNTARPVAPPRQITVKKAVAPKKKNVDDGTPFFAATK